MREAEFKVRSPKSKVPKADLCVLKMTLDSGGSTFDL